MRLHRWLLTLGVLLNACAPAATPNPTTSAPTATPMPTLTPTPKPELGTTRVDAFGIEQVWVPAGTFMMGTLAEVMAELKPPRFAAQAQQPESEQPAHTVEITHGFWIDKNEVTNAAFEAFVQAGGYDKQEFWSEAGWQWRQSRAMQLPIDCKDKRPDVPRVCITWFEAEAYAKWRGGQLPTEAQWEFAARGPESRLYPWGNEWDETKSNLSGSIGLKPVGTYPAGASWVGAQDMAGNAMEWVHDWWSISYYAESPAQNPTGPATGARKVEKGGWWGGPSPSYIARSAYRHFEDPPGYQDHHIGFRIITIPP